MRSGSFRIIWSLLGLLLLTFPLGAQALPTAGPSTFQYTKIQLPTWNQEHPSIRRLNQRLDSFYRVEVARGFNGSVLVAYKGHPIYERYYGWANHAAGIRLSANTPSQLASTSKPFVATVVLWLHQGHYLDINKPVNYYLKEFPYGNITVKMLLDHRSGLPKYLNYGSSYWSPSVLRSNQNLLDLFATKKPRLAFTPGTRFQYCNSNYAVLASLIERIVEMPFPKFMKEFIFEPLGMHHTFVYDPIRNPIDRGRLALSYKSAWSVYPDTFSDGIYGDKNIYSTPQDLLKWDQSFYNHVFLTAAMERLAYTGNSAGMSDYRNYGLGWRMRDYPSGYKLIYHNGWWHGNNNVFYRFVQDGFTIIVLGNKLNHKIYNQAKVIYEIVQDENPHQLRNLKG